MIRYSLIVVVLGLLAFAAYSLLRTRTVDEKLAALRKEMAPKGATIFETVIQGKAAAFLLRDCAVYSIDLNSEKLDQTKVLKPGFYPWFTVCTDQTIRSENGYILVHLANQAIGAGGGNISGGDYRSLDGSIWEKRSGRVWLPVEKAQN
ncbi:hypothetical protein [Bryobacter aggregatus]|uniref:hypothetical protein n=1 Tax=Bryobacter aggregatus TaxID=360054 RepID=UPI0006891F8E|nr:hypothetical protein [Bryobacter aggregatus]